MDDKEKGEKTKDGFEVIELIEDVSHGQRGYVRNIDRLAKKFTDTFKKEHSLLAAQSIERAKKIHSLEYGKGMLSMIAKGFKIPEKNHDTLRISSNKTI